MRKNNKDETRKILLASLITAFVFTLIYFLSMAPFGAQIFAVLFLVETFIVYTGYEFLRININREHMKTYKLNNF